jgi:RNA-splicing ligase RtcB
VIITENMICPHMIGNDIGCGMSLFRTDIERRRMKLERMIILEFSYIRNNIAIYGKAML